jgi:CBS domain-containing protein
MSVVVNSWEVLNARDGRNDDRRDHGGSGCDGPKLGHAARGAWISGAPVVDSDGRLVGIISEGDLLHRAEIGTARRHRVRRRSWWLDHFASELARDYVKSHARTVKEIMTREFVTVVEDTELAEVASLRGKSGLSSDPK